MPRKRPRRIRTMTGSLRFLLVAGALSVASIGCPASRPMQVPPSAAPVVATVPAATDSPPEADAPVRSAGGRPDGAACFSSENCSSNICEGASCDSSRPGTCVPKVRPCTSDLVEYCGCDGKTFLSSSACPGEAFSERGACPGEVLDSAPRTSEPGAEEAIPSSFEAS